MIIPYNASNRYMPVTRNVPLDLLNAKNYWQKFKLWKFGLPKEILIEDFYQLIPKNCNKFFGFNENEQVCCFVPKTFIFNGASVPKVLSSLYLPTGILYLGAFHHDFIYTYGGLLLFTESMDKMVFYTTTQAIADKLFYEINEEVNKFRTATYPAYITLRSVGWVVWNNSRKKDTFIQDFPWLEKEYNEKI